MEQAQARLRAQINELQREMEALEGRQDDWLQDDAEQAQLRELRQRRLMERVGPTDRGPDASLIR
jgi:DNA repair exonuclease SbcCD ATPase subunit